MEHQMTFKEGHDLIAPLLKCGAYVAQAKEKRGDLYEAVDHIITEIAKADDAFLSENPKYRNPIIAGMRYDMIELGKELQLVIINARASNWHFVTEEKEKVK
jgi:hypothetical protein